jgi:hypothetical protein
MLLCQYISLLVSNLVGKGLVQIGCTRVATYQTSSMQNYRIRILYV